ncbi:FKBP-type peptidylprolyl isomerase [Nitritalea halalkaliphila LW7]|uniref:Peptidyl-prolyl cis-trans isomerase n=1 Tax=Nitritalea halalkaliphila LW7 TaxID=1189621 RepID=I5BVW5_9BACT|nr:FKBP-type peptidyl-prolyl cis-trans isomerase [Nitritalea halalkaliphila]EIM73717.1 FKBP-type peptidylprolyl isomerase [Nitritalea halalkaliphila LW7]
MKKFTVFGLLTLLGVLGFSCINEQESFEAQLDRDIEQLQQFVDDNEIDVIRQFPPVDQPSGNGLRVLFTALGTQMQRPGQNPVLAELPEFGDTIAVEYVGRFVNGVAFDTSIEAIAREEGLFNPQRTYSPLEFRLGINRLIPGFEWGVEQMRVGDKAFVLIPSIFGYGRSGQGSIPPNTPLVFEIEMVSLNGHRVPGNFDEEEEEEDEEELEDEDDA